MMGRFIDYESLVFRGLRPIKQNVCGDLAFYPPPRHHMCGARNRLIGLDLSTFLSIYSAVYLSVSLSYDCYL